MIARRDLVLTSVPVAAEAPLVRDEAGAADDAAAVINAIHTRIAKDKDNDGGCVRAEKAGKAKYLTKSPTTQRKKADAHVPKGDVVGVIAFDPVTNAQDPDVKSFKVEAEKLDAGKA